MNYKKIFVSGGAGVIGTALVSSLLKGDFEIFVGDLKPCPKAWEGKVKYRQGDLNEITLKELEDFQPDLFFHLAATFERSTETPPFFEENFHHNVSLSHHLLDCLKQIKSMKRIVFASSYLIYDPKLYLHSEQQSIIPLSETSQIAPRNICGAAKLFFESELEFIHSFANISAISARIFRVYGRGSNDIISRWIRSLIKNEELRVYRPEGQFDYIFADDVATGLVHLAESDYSGIVNLGTGNPRSVKQVLAILGKHFPKLKAVNSPSDILIESSSADMDKFRRLTRWTPSTTLEDGIATLVDYYTNHV